MSLFSWMARTSQPAQALRPGRVQLRSRLSARVSALAVIAADVFGAQADTLPVTRDEAMRVPAVVSARTRLCSAIGRGVLAAYDGTEKIDAPPWTYRSASAQSPQQRLFWTADDLLFYGHALWAVSRESAGMLTGQITDAVRVPPDQWSLDESGKITVETDATQVLTAQGLSEIVLFTGWDDGLLVTGATYVRAATELHRTVRARVRVPIPHTVIRATDPTMELEESEAQALVESWVTARRRIDDGAVSYLPAGLVVESLGAQDVALFESGRNAEVLDFARLTGVPATLLEASGVSASLTYETREAARSLFGEVVRDRALFIESRLSMDDVSTPGTRIALDLTATQDDGTGLPAPTED